MSGTILEHAEAALDLAQRVDEAVKRGRMPSSIDTTTLSAHLSAIRSDLAPLAIDVFPRAAHSHSEPE